MKKQTKKRIKEVAHIINKSIIPFVVGWGLYSWYVFFGWNKIVAICVGLLGSSIAGFAEGKKE